MRGDAPPFQMSFRERGWWWTPKSGFENNFFTELRLPPRGAPSCCTGCDKTFATITGLDDPWGDVAGLAPTNPSHFSNACEGVVLRRTQLRAPPAKVAMDTFPQADIPRLGPLQVHLAARWAYARLSWVISQVIMV